MIRERTLNAALATLLLAAPWCLVQTRENYFFLMLSEAIYLRNIGGWLLIFAGAWCLLALVGRRSAAAERRAALFLFLFAPIQVADYAARTFLGPVGRWPSTWLLAWGAGSALWFPGAAAFALRFEPAPATLQKIRRALTVPGALLLFYALPKGFVADRHDLPARQGDRPPVHIMLFDMLSVDSFYENGEVSPRLRRFSAFAEKADVFLEARSPGPTTGESMPRFLTGIDFEEVGHEGVTWMGRRKGESSLRPLSEHGSLFSDAQAAGYDVFLSAFGFPYVENFRPSLQQARTYPFEALWRLGMHGLIWPVLWPGGLQQRSIASQIAADYLDRVQVRARNTLFYTHWNLPHDPMIFDASGDPLSHVGLSRDILLRVSRHERYPGQLLGLDRIFGTVIDAIRASGTYDESTIVVLSDHNMGRSGLDMTRVPLLVKHPRQEQGRLVSAPVQTRALRGVLAQVWEGKPGDLWSH